jgi:hypothetical protein
VRRLPLLIALSVAAALLPAATAPVQADALTKPVPGGFAKVVLDGPAGQTVQLQSGDRLSAPIKLDGTPQVAGISVAEAGLLKVVGSTRGVTLRAAASSVGATTSTVRAGTRIVEVNGQPFTAKGYLYWPAQIGYEWPASTWADPASCQNDARLMGGAGVTLLRVPFEDHEPQVKDQYQACLDAFHAHGISVLWLFGPPSQLEHIQGDDTFVQLYADKLATAVRDVGDHPATAFWTVGNEIERSNDGKLWLGDKATNAPAMLERLLQGMKALDGNRHLAGTTICCPIPDWLRNANVPSLDFWGLNAYHQPYYDAVNWFNTLNASDPRPKIITETGTDRYNCIPSIVAGEAIAATCKTSYKNPGAHSGEHQGNQRDWNLTIWDNINAALSTPARPDGAVFGVTMFMWSDLWWFSLGFLVPSSTVVHEVIGATPWSAPDGIINIEWHGVSVAQPPGATDPRVTSLAFDALAGRWATTPPPTMSGITASADPLAGTVTVSWTTSEPATSEVQAGVNLEENRDGGDARSDSTILQRVAHDTALKTSHSVTFLAPTADPGICQKVAPRSFTADGRSVTAATLIVGCPSTQRFGGV